MASDSAHTYPAVLQSSLNKALPGAHFAVINRGMGGQDAPEELTRLDTDVIALHPQLVIWQVG
ncbi:MAG: acyl-CoA thioesterase, partial [Acetobacteraceae bacterium]|nr:acyl-CoA thioesterase [Acetobacteraceae bacterium]